MTRRGPHSSSKWLWLLVAVPVLVGLARVRLDVEVLNLLPGTLPAVQGLKLYQAHFTNARELMVTLKAADAEEAQAAAQSVTRALRARGDLVGTVTWRPPWLDHPGEFPELLAYLWLNQPPENFSQLEQRLDPAKLSAKFAETKAELATSLSPEVIARLSYDPLGLTELPSEAGGPGSVTDFSVSAFSSEGPFANAEGNFRVIYVQARDPVRSYAECEQWLTSVRQVVQTALTRGTHKAVPAYTGRPAFVAEIARGMQRDIAGSVLGTAAVISILFWMAHRRLKPLLWLLFLLGIILTGTLGLGGLLFGTINVISLGFAAILLGLAVDYALVHYQEALAHPNLSVRQVRRMIAPGVAWAAITTISAFLVLNAAGLPGLAQLGTLVAIGVALGAAVIVWEYLPPLFRERSKPEDSPQQPQAYPDEPSAATNSNGAPLLAARVFSLLLAMIAFLVLARGLPNLDPTGDALRPRGSPAYKALAELQEALVQQRQPLWLIFSAPNESLLRQRVLETGNMLKGFQREGHIQEFTLPLPLLPNPDAQSVNLKVARRLGSLREQLTATAKSQGFASEATSMAAGMLDAFGAADDLLFFPTNQLGAWFLNKAFARGSNEVFAIGLVRPDGKLESSELSQINQRLPAGAWLSGWELIGQAVFDIVKQRVWLLVVPMIALVILSLIIAFRRWAEVVLSIAALALGGAFLLAIMSVAGWSWNLMNLMALPLILGTGVDYSIFMQLALRRHAGNVTEVYHSTGKALALCGLTAMAGFGSLAFSSNAGMASLGRVCASGIVCNMFVALLLLPSWWQRLTLNRLEKLEIRRPSRLYSATAWRLGLFLVRIIPSKIARAFGSLAARTYALLCPRRHHIVIQNLLPAVNDNLPAARKAARSLFGRFGIKIADLLRYEAGLPIEDLLGDAVGYEHLARAQAGGRGAVLVNIHLGNWELGAQWLVRKGVEFKVITQTEPGTNFTELRRACREQRKIQTVIVGNDSFAFLEVIRLLEAGAAVALLVDRPTSQTDVRVSLFGRPFASSLAAAELARATGCALVPGYVIWNKTHYQARLLPEVPYDRASLRKRENREKLSQEIMNRFEPVLRKHPDQWFHFVPIWPDPQSPPGRGETT